MCPHGDKLAEEQFTSSQIEEVVEKEMNGAARWQLCVEVVNARAQEYRVYLAGAVLRDLMGHMLDDPLPGIVLVTVETVAVGTIPLEDRFPKRCAC